MYGTSVLYPRKKVKKVLDNVDGVYDTNIDTKQQKVTVTGNIEAKALINKLAKSGKNAELWPEPIMKKEKKPGKSKKKEKQIESKTKTADQDEGRKDPEKEKSTVKVDEIPQEIVKKIEVNPAQVPEKGENSDANVKIADSNVKNCGNGEVAKTQAEGKKPETTSACNLSPEAEKKSESKASGNVSSGKKKNKGSKIPTEGEQSNAAATAFSESALPALTDHSPPRHHGYQYTPNYHASASQPVYAVSCNTAHPSSSYTASYYASPPPYSYAYTHAGLEMQPPQSDIDLYPHQPLDSLKIFSDEMQPPQSDIDSYPHQPLDSFEILSDENPNGCLIM